MRLPHPGVRRAVEHELDPGRRRDHAPQPADEGRGRRGPQRARPTAEGVQEVRPVDDQTVRPGERVGAAGGHRQRRRSTLAGARGRTGCAHGVRCPRSSCISARRAATGRDGRRVGPTHTAGVCTRCATGSVRSRSSPTIARCSSCSSTSTAWCTAAPSPSRASPRSSPPGRAAGDDVVYVTNNSMHYRADYVTRLAGMGAPVSADTVIRSARATALYLAEQASADPTGPGAGRRRARTGGPGRRASRS